MKERIEGERPFIFHNTITSKLNIGEKIYSFPPICSERVDLEIQDNNLCQNVKFAKIPSHVKLPLERLEQLQSVKVTITSYTH